MIILGIETSCDETAVSVVEAEGGLDSFSFKLLGSALHSQIEVHKQYGGVFPTLAKREHIKNLPIVYEQSLKNAGVSEEKIDMVAVTVGPGLEPALWTGIKFAEELGKKLGVPVIPANHMLGHITSVLFNKTDKNSKSEIRNPKNLEFGDSNFEFPAIALLISGGHTELVLLKNWIEKEKIGETQDDAVGEAFDKVARMLGLPYPGGPEISRLAEQAREQGVHLETKLPRPMIHSKDFNFSFSGLKTAVLYYLKEITHPALSYNKRGTFGKPLSLNCKKRGLGDELSARQKTEIAREFEDAVIETLISKTKKAMGEYLPKTLIIGGGVIANKALRENFLKLKEIYPDVEILIPDKMLTTDNATMIAAAGFIEYLATKKLDRELKAQGNLSLS